MSVLEPVEQFVVPRSLVESTVEVLQEIGGRGFEAFVLWGGQFHESDNFRFTSAYCPEQQTSSGEEGLLVVVDGDALFRANRAFYERGEILAAQVHSHPTAAYHSSTDDEFPMMTLVGGLSAVVPDFASAGSAGTDSWAWYRLTAHREWVELDSDRMIRFAE